MLGGYFCTTARKWVHEPGFRSRPRQHSRPLKLEAGPLQTALGNALSFASAMKAVYMEPGSCTHLRAVVQK